MGAAFPSAQALVSQRLDSLGRHTGTLLFSNIVGNVVGTLVVGFVALDRIGTSGTYLVLALLLSALGVAWAWQMRGLARWLAFVGVVVVMGLLVAATPRNQRFWSFLNGVPEQDLSLAEDRSCATALKEVDGTKVLTINAASTKRLPIRRLPRPDRVDTDGGPSGSATRAGRWSRYRGDPLRPVRRPALGRDDRRRAVRRRDHAARGSRRRRRARTCNGSLPTTGRR